MGLGYEIENFRDTAIQCFDLVDCLLMDISLKRMFQHEILVFVFLFLFLGSFSHCPTLNFDVLTQKLAQQNGFGANPENASGKVQVREV